MLRTRGLKILRDVLARKGRTTLVVLSILIGVFGVTVLVSVNDLIVQQLNNDLQESEIAHTHVYVSASDGHTTLEENATYLAQLAQLPHVQQVEGQAIYPVNWRIMNSDSDYTAGIMLAYTEPFGNIQLEPPARVIEGRYPEVGQHEVAVEQRFADKYGIVIGDKLVFRQANGSSTAWEVVGTVFHAYFTITTYAGIQNIEPSQSLYANYTDAQEIVQFPGLSSIYVRYDDTSTAKAEQTRLNEVIASTTPYTPFFTFIDDPENSYLVTVVRQVVNVLNMLAVISMVVSGFLVTNVVNTVVLEQKRQIGVMKSLGATRWDSILIYVGTALVYGIFGTVVGVLMAIPVAAVLLRELAPMALTYVDDFRISWVGIGIGAMMGLLIPILAALVPVYNGTRVTILEAMTDFGIASNWGKTRFSSWIGRLPLPMSIRQALSNIAQKKGRLALTGFTLTLAVAAFMGVTAAFKGIGDTITNLYETYNFDIYFVSQQAINHEEIPALLMSNSKNVRSVFPGYAVSVAIEEYRSEELFNEGSNELNATGIDPTSPVIDFDLESGEGWQQDPTRVGVIVTQSLAEKIHKNNGDTVNITVNGTIHTYEVLGIDRFPFDAIFFDWRELARIAGYTDANSNPVTNSFYVSLEGNPSIDRVDDAISQLEEILLANGIQATFVNQAKVADEQAQSFNMFGLIFNISSAVMAAVGAIGLLAALSMAVYERQKEIGVMRSIGARSLTIISQFLTEGLLIGLLAWVVALPLSIVLSIQLTDALGLGSSFHFEYPPQIAVIGLFGVAIVAMIASIWPSLAAARKTVSDILRYQ